MPTSSQTAQALSLNDREQIQYLLGNPPSWMMRYGISSMVGFFVLLLTLSYFIHFPDVVEAKITLTTTHPPIRVIAQTGGRISDLQVRDHQIVEKGQVLAVMESTADWQDIQLLEDWLEKGNDPQAKLLTGLQLGSLQTAYSTFSQHWQDYHYFLNNNNTAERIAALQNEIAQLRTMNGNLLRQETILKEEFALTTKEWERQKRLHVEKIIADADFEKSEGGWLQQKRQIEAAGAVILQNQIQIQQLQSQGHELSLTKADNGNDKQLVLAEDQQRLLSTMAEWRQQYLIVAPIQGEVSLAKIWSAQQTVAAGDEILAVLSTASTPGKNMPIIGKAAVSDIDMGKLKPGSRAVIRIDAYPAQQYGSVEGQITNISALPQKNEYLVEVALPNALLTSYNKTLPFRQEMAGEVHIITEERRVIERIFDRLNDLLKNR